MAHWKFEVVGNSTNQAVRALHAAAIAVDVVAEGDFILIFSQTPVKLSAEGYGHSMSLKCERGNDCTYMPYNETHAAGVILASPRHNIGHIGMPSHHF